jgi:hypothetical protein
VTGLVIIFCIGALAVLAIAAVLVATLLMTVPIDKPPPRKRRRQNRSLTKCQLHLAIPNLKLSNPRPNHCTHMTALDFSKPLPLN